MDTDKRGKTKMSRPQILDGLMTLIAEAVVKKMIEEEGGGAVRD